MSTDKVRLLLPEYGRNVQKMVKFLKTIEDRDLRNHQAEVVVGLMGNLYPNKRDTDDFQHMLWDHLFMISEFDLDVDSPYPKPDPKMFFPKPTHLSYTQSQDSDRNWGRYLPKMIKAIANKEGASENDKAILAKNIANFAKQKSSESGNEPPLNSAIVLDIERFSEGKLIVNATDITELRADKQKKNNFKNCNGKGSVSKRFKTSNNHKSKR